jgi:hypothetical protein
MKTFLIDLWGWGGFFLAFFAITIVKNNPDLWWVGDIMVLVSLISTVVWSGVKIFMSVEKRIKELEDNE